MNSPNSLARDLLELSPTVRRNFWEVELKMREGRARSRSSGREEESGNNQWKMEFWDVGKVFLPGASC